MKKIIVAMGIFLVLTIMTFSAITVRPSQERYWSPPYSKTSYYFDIATMNETSYPITISFQANNSQKEGGLLSFGTFTVAPGSTYVINRVEWFFMHYKLRADGNGRIIISSPMQPSVVNTYMLLSERERVEQKLLTINKDILYGENFNIQFGASSSTQLVIYAKEHPESSGGKHK